jgi:pimeloyl-ACP methyl ester carboxylesterase
MSAFYFGDRKRRLFGMYHAPAPCEGPPRALVLCNSWGPDYIYSHRTVRQAAIQLAAAGFHVLRFDYFGTGDSAGELTEANLAMWEEDIHSAINEVLQMSGASRVLLIGLRLGALLAGRVAESESSKVGQLMLWDPVVSGSAFLDELFRNSRSDPEMFRKVRPRPASDGGGHELQGFPLTDAMALEIRNLDLANLRGVVASYGVLLSVPESEAVRVEQRLVPLFNPATIERVPAFPCWVNQWPPSTRSMPVTFLRRLVERACEMS